MHIRPIMNGDCRKHVGFLHFIQKIATISAICTYFALARWPKLSYDTNNHPERATLLHPSRADVERKS